MALTLFFRCCIDRAMTFTEPVASISHILKEKMARLEGLEPPTYRFEVCRSIQLSYRREN